MTENYIKASPNLTHNNCLMSYIRNISYPRKSPTGVRGGSQLWVILLIKLYNFVRPLYDLHDSISSVGVAYRVENTGDFHECGYVLRSEPSAGIINRFIKSKKIRFFVSPHETSVLMFAIYLGDAGGLRKMEAQKNTV